MLEAASDPWSHRLSSPSAIHRQGVSIGVTGRVLLLLPLPQNGLSSYENHSHNSVTPHPHKSEAMYRGVLYTVFALLLKCAHSQPRQDL